MTPGLSDPLPRLSTTRPPCRKPVFRFDGACPSAGEPEWRSDLRFFATVWAAGFVVFYSFLF